MSSNKCVKVLIVDDSAIVRNSLASSLNKRAEIEVVGTAIDPYSAREKIISLKPDVITLDIEMPRMDGLTFLDKLMKHYPIPVLIVSSIAPEGSRSYFRALELGAFDVISKPESAFGPDIAKKVSLIADKIKAAANVNMEARRKLAAISPGRSARRTKNNGSRAMVETTQKIVAVGASTGGTTTFQAFLAGFAGICPPMLVVQHMPSVFTESYAQRLNDMFPMEVKEARDGDRLLANRVLIAPGNYHMLLRRSGARYYVEMNQAPPVCYVRPSVDVLFYSVADYAGANSIGVILTGMGSDGANGLLKMKNSGAFTMAQDENTSIVYGMPKAAAEKNAADMILPVDKIPEQIISRAGAQS